MKTVTVWLMLTAVALSEAHTLAQEVDDTIVDSATPPPSGTSPSSSHPAIACDGLIACSDKYEPVCTSKGRTYRNKCEFKNAYCEQPSDDFYIVSKGECDQQLQVQSIDDDGDDTVTAEVLNVPIELSDSSAAPQQEEIDCSDGRIQFDPQDDPVCTSYGRTYRNYLEFKNAYCEKPSPSFYIVSKGECDQTFQALSVEDGEGDEEQIVTASVLNVPIELDDAESPSEPVDREPIDCKSGWLACGPEYEPVCTSYGRTYRNKCEFKNAYCEKPSDDFYIVATEACTTPPLRVQSDDESEVSEDVINAPIEIEEGVDDDVDIVDTTPRSEATRVNLYCELSCPTGEMLVAPICGTDSRSYINDCHLLSTKCELPELEKQYDGLCVVGAGRPPQGAASGTSQPAGLAPQEIRSNRCNSYCGKDYKPVCGSNGITYANECLLEYAMCQTPTITKLGDGKCAEVYGGGNNQGNPNEPCVPTACPSTSAPVCGSDGQTYLNACLLKNAQCQIPGLSVVHDGPCDHDTVLTCASLTCPRYTECREEPGTRVAYCADVCHPDRCAPNEECRLLKSECFTAACSPVATCVPKGDNAFADY